MARAHDLLAEYGESHQHPVNKSIHWVCVPLIVWSLLGMLWSIKTPAYLSMLHLNWAILVTMLAMVYYILVSRILAMGVLIVLLLLLMTIYWLEQAGASIWQFSIAVFVLAWIGQFIGHSIEGKRPSFFKDVQFLLIGPLWLLSFAYKKLGIQY